MADIMARQRQIHGNAAEWGLHNLVLGAGELALVRPGDGTVRAKVGDGATPFSACPYLEGGSAAFVYRGAANPTAAPPAGAVSGDAYSASPGGTVAASWGAPAAGTVVAAGDLLVMDSAGKWNVIPGPGDLTGVVIEADLAGTGGAAMVGTASGLTVQQYLDAASIVVPNRTVLGDIAAPANNAAALLTEAGREGMFVFSSANLSAQVTADPRQGIYVPPAGQTGATGAWVRRVSGPVLATWFRDASGDDTQAIKSALATADATSGFVLLTSGLWRYSGYMEMPAGVSLSGPPDAILKPVDQVTSALTASITSGTGAKVISVADTAAFAPGRNVIIVSTSAHTVSPSDSFNHRGRVVASRSAASGPGTVTLAAGPNISAHASGDLLALSTMGLIMTGANRLEGITIDGNAASHIYAHWITSTPIIQEGSNCSRLGLTIQNTPSDAVLCGGPSGGEIIGAFDNGCSMTNIGGNGIHYGNCREVRAIGCAGILGNVRYQLPIEQGGGAGNRSGHQDGFVILSNDVLDVKVVGCTAEDWICGVGAIGTTVVGGAQKNDDILVTGCSFIDCFRPFEAIQTAKRLSFTGNRCRARFPFNTGSMRWNSQTIYVAGDTVDGFAMDVTIAANNVKNGTIFASVVRGLSITGNVIDNRDLNATAASLLDKAYGIAIFSFSGVSVTGNTVNGGFVSLYLQNSFPPANNVCRDSLITGNVFLNPYGRAVSGAIGAGGQVNVDVIGNTMAARTADTLEDGTTPLTFNLAGWRATTALVGMRYENNRIDFDVPAGAAWDSGDVGVIASRWNNMVNGARELPANAASDAAAATANVAIGARYRNASALMVRIA